MPKPAVAAALAVWLALAALAETAFAAVTVSNRDDTEQTITVIEDKGAKSADHVLKPGQKLEGICPKGCVIRLNGKPEDEYELEVDDKVSIEDGFVYYDDAKEPAALGAAPPLGLPLKK